MLQEVNVTKPLSLVHTGVKIAACVRKEKLQLCHFAIILTET